MSVQTLSRSSLHVQTQLLATRSCNIDPSPWVGSLPRCSCQLQASSISKEWSAKTLMTQSYQGSRVARPWELARLGCTAAVKKDVKRRWVGVCRAGKDDYYLVDVEGSVGDGFSFAGGKYSEERGPYEDWVEKGKVLEAGPVQAASGDGVKDPIFGLKMGIESQVGENAFRWFYVEEGSETAPAVLLLHGLPSQSYSFRKVLPILAEAGFRAIALDWLGFGFSDKPQPGPAFDYSTSKYAEGLGYFIDSLGLEKVTLVAQGYLAPAVVQWAAANKDRVEKLVLINPPVTDEHAKLPGALSTFTGFLLGEIFAQDPIKASDSVLNACGPYVLDEEDAMVYRRPYLTSGMAGFALTGITRKLQKELKDTISATRSALAGWNQPLTVIWGLKDRWLRFNGVEAFVKSVGGSLVQLDQVGHHAQEDYGETVGEALKNALRRAT